jgi:hypothetical protein
MARGAYKVPRIAFTLWRPDLAAFAASNVSRLGGHPALRFAVDQVRRTSCSGCPSLPQAGNTKGQSPWRLASCPRSSATAKDDSGTARACRSSTAARSACSG